MNPISANLMRGPSMGEWLLSQRDKPNVAWHEVPGKASLEEPSRRVRYNRGAADPTGISRRNVHRVFLGRLNTLLERFVPDGVRAAAQSNGSGLRDTDAEYAIARCQGKLRRFGNF